MNLTGSQEELLQAYVRERLAFLPYVRQTSPYTRRSDRPILRRLWEIADIEAEESAKLAEQLIKEHVVVPLLGGFPSEFTNYNFFDLRKLLPILVADHQRLIAKLNKSNNSFLLHMKLKKETHLQELVSFGNSSESITGSSTS